MTRAGGRVMMLKDDANGSTDDKGGNARVAGGPRPVKDRWMADLIRHASGSPNQAEPPPVSSKLPEPPPPEHLPERLQQAVRWGYQEREFAQYEASLSRRATLGELLSWARTRRGCTAEELGQRAGVGPDRIQAIERDEICPLDVAPERMARVAAALDISIFTVLERLQSMRNGSDSVGHRVLPALPSSPAPDAVWSNGTRHARSPFERLCLRDSTQSPAKSPDLSGYCQALYQAWRKHQRETSSE